MSPFGAMGTERRMAIVRDLMNVPGWTRLGDATPESSFDRRTLCRAGVIERRATAKAVTYRITDLGVRLARLGFGWQVYAGLGHETREATARMLLDKGPMTAAAVYQALPLTKQAFYVQRDVMARAGVLAAESCSCGHGRILTATTTAGALIAAVDIELSAVTP